MTQQKTNIWAINLFGIALYAILFGGSTFALPLLAADMPCVKEVCIGDDLSKLHGIKFQSVNASRAEKVCTRKRIQRTEMYGKSQQTELPAYMVLGEIDENALDEMAKIKVACSPANGLDGTFVSDSGYKTSVQVALWSDKSGNMKLLVKGISRAYKGVQSGSKTEQLIQDLREKYAKWDMGKGGQPKPGQAGMMLIPVHEPILTLILTPTAEVISPDSYKKNPLCKPSKKLI